MVLPVRDGAATLDAAIRSVLESRGVEVELICIDDGSSDDTPKILEHWSGSRQAVRCIRQPPHGLVPALNAGLARARSRYIARMDADDIVHPERLVAQVALLEARPDLALVGCGVEVFRDGPRRAPAEGYRIHAEWVNGLVDPQAIRREAFIECPVPHPTWMFRAALVNRLGGYRDHGWPEDLDLLYRLLAAGHAVGKVPRILHRWRDHPGRLSRRDPRYGRQAFARVKAHHLARVHPLNGAVVWGAGRTGRRLVPLLAEAGIPTHALIDIHAPRVGRRWRGIPILAPEELSRHAETWRDAGLRILGAVARRGARARIRTTLVALGLREGADFLMLA